MDKGLDLVCVGRMAIDLYAEELCTSLSEARRFLRYPGGTSANLAVGAARLGLRVAVAGAVGADPSGTFLRGRLAAEGIDESAVTTRADRRTALAFLGMEEPEAVALDFYRERAADTEIGLTPALALLLRRTRAAAFCGSHFADAEVAERLLPLLAAAREGGADCILDLDYRPQVWAKAEGGVIGAAARVARAARQCQIVAGNAEEWALVADVADPAGEPESLRRRIGAGITLLKLGAEGAVAAAAEGSFVAVPGHAVPVLNPVGAGDGFLAGFLAAHLGGAPLPEALAQGNLCGAIVVSRHGCAAAMPFAGELQQARRMGPMAHAVADSHRAASRPGRPDPVIALACDHRVPFAELATANGRGSEAIARFKTLVTDAALAVAEALDFAPAALMDARYGTAELTRLTRAGAWVGRPVEVTRSRPLAFEAGEDIAAELRRWHPRHIAKCLVWHHPDDPEPLASRQVARLQALQAAARSAEIEWILEVVPPEADVRDDATLIRAVDGLCRAGLRPDYWKLPPLRSAAAWSDLDQLIAAGNPHCRGVLVLGLDRPLDELAPALMLAARAAICRGLAIGRSLFGDAAQDWFAGRIDDDAARSAIAARYAVAAQAFLSARRSAHDDPVRVADA